MKDLWALTFGQPWVDAEELSLALERQVADEQQLDARTKLLVRDSLQALSEFWGPERLEVWLARSAGGTVLRKLQKTVVEPPGFPTLNRRLMQKTAPQAVLEMLRDLGSQLGHREQLTIGGSIALILSGQLSRATEDIDVVDEVPAQIRAEHKLLDQLAGRYGLRLTHFQSHYLPDGWQQRIHSLGRFGELDVSLLDSCDIFVGKLFSKREKDRDDLRVLSKVLDKMRVEDLVRSSASRLAADPERAEHARQNWYIIYGEQPSLGF